jgi:nucleotide-binding universal stress UspA family protein
MKILVAVDGSATTKRMLAFLAAHDEWLGGRHEYTVVHAVHPLPARAAAAIDKSIVQEHYRESAELVFKPIRAFFVKQGLRADFQYKVGDAAGVVSAVADKQRFDLLVMGSHGKGALANLVLGSVATKVLALSKLPVMLIR